jgi:hypothetical protein
MVCADPTVSPHHHFGNTPKGFKCAPSGAIIHIVNANTVQALSQAAGVPLAPARFRPNLVLAGFPPWAEFGWVGREVRIGGANGVTLEILNRTVRCAGINVDARHGSGRTSPVALTLNLDGVGQGGRIWTSLRYWRGISPRMGPIWGSTLGWCLRVSWE